MLWSRMKDGLDESTGAANAVGARSRPQMIPRSPEGPGKNLDSLIAVTILLNEDSCPQGARDLEVAGGMSDVYIFRASSYRG